jgi:hypothetical protein
MTMVMHAMSHSTTEGTGGTVEGQHRSRSTHTCASHQQHRQCPLPPQVVVQNIAAKQHKEALKALQQSSCSSHVVELHLRVVMDIRAVATLCGVQVFNAQHSAWVHKAHTSQVFVQRAPASDIS